MPRDFSALEVGFDIPATPGMPLEEVQTPCLILDLGAFERNLRNLDFQAIEMGIKLRPHAKMHKSVDVANRQLQLGSAIGICCQKVSEAEVFARAGVADILLTNQVTDPAKIDRLARLPTYGSRLTCCVDSAGSVADLSRAAARYDTTLDMLIEVNVGADRCGLAVGEQLVEVARAISGAPRLEFAGVQAYQGSMQHIVEPADRRAAALDAIDLARQAVAILARGGLPCRTVTGAGSGSYRLEAQSGLYTELQCGSYAFMDADYQRVIPDPEDPVLPFENALFLHTSIMSTAVAGQAVCDAGLKVQSVDSGLPTVFDQPGVQYVACSDEHGTLSDPTGQLTINQKINLVPGHCDPTCNLHDWYVCVRDGIVEDVWPVSARGKSL